MKWLLLIAVPWRRWRSAMTAAPVMFFRKLPLAWRSTAAALGALTVTVAGIALLVSGVITTSTATVTTTGCSGERTAGSPPNCAPGAAQAVAPADAVSAISAGQGFTCALTNGGAWCWGHNEFGQLGNNSTDSTAPVDRSSRKHPVSVLGLASGVTAISVGKLNSCALKHGGVWCWGVEPRALKHGMEHGVTAISAAKDHACALKDDGGVWCWEDGPTTGPPVPVASLTSGVTAISAGWGISCALKDGGAWCWGSNWAGQLGNNSATDSLVPVAVSGLRSGVSAISAGGSHVCAIKDGGVWCWGADGEGQLGTDSARAVCGLWADRCSQAPVPVPGLTIGVSAISAGGDHTCALKDGGVWCWGSNGGGELGNNSTTPSLVPEGVSGLGSGVSAISTGGDHTCALKGGGAWCWGYNQFGSLGDNMNSPVPVPVQFPPPSAGGNTGASDAQTLSSLALSDSDSHRTVYALTGIAVVALVIISVGGWTMRRRHR